MGITAEQKFLLNRMNATAFKVGLGDLIEAAESVVAAEIALANGAVLIGNGSGVAVGIVPTGDVTVTNAGVTAIGAKKVLTAMINDLAVDAGQIAANAVTSAKILDGNVTLAKIATAAKPIYHVVGGGIFTSAGGDANEAITAAGCLGTDTAIVWVQKAGATPRTVDTITPGTGSIAVVLSGDPSTDHKLGWIILRAAA